MEENNENIMKNVVIIEIKMKKEDKIDINIRFLIKHNGPSDVHRSYKLGNQVYKVKLGITKDKET